MAPAPTPLRVALVVALAIGAVVAGGFLLISEEPTRPSDAEIDNATERFESLDGVTGRLETTSTIGNETTRTVRRIEVRPGTGKYRTEAIGGNTSGFDTVVSNGTVTWYYDSDNRTVQRTVTDVAANGSTVLPGGRFVEQLLSAAFEDSNESAGVSALPMVSAPTGARPSGSLPGNQSATEINVTYVGTDGVGDRETYVFDLEQTADGDSFGNYSGRVWIDTERPVVLQQRVNFSVDGRQYATRTRYRNLSFGVDIPDERFEFDPPADATVSTSRTMQFDSRQELVAATDLAVPDPEVPDGFDFDRGTRIVTDRRSVSVQYSNGSASITVSVQNRTGGVGTGDAGRNVTVGSANGTLQTIGQSRLLGWECDGRTYSVIGAGVGNETVIETARSVGCE